MPENEVDLYLYESFHRLDLSIGYSSEGQRLSHHGKIALMNVYNGVNPANATTCQDSEGGQVTTQADLPRMLQISYLVRF